MSSGSLRVEIEHLLEKMGVREAFRVLVTADEVERSKPEPEVFLKALAGLQQLPSFQRDGIPPLRSTECLVIEDEPAGVRAAHAAGIKWLALAHSRSSADLRRADGVQGCFGDVAVEGIGRAFSAR